MKALFIAAALSATVLASARCRLQAKPFVANASTSTTSGDLGDRAALAEGLSDPEQLRRWPRSLPWPGVSRIRSVVPTKIVAAGSGATIFSEDGRLQLGGDQASGPVKHARGRYGR
jgi:hypothetical protein